MLAPIFYIQKFEYEYSIPIALTRGIFECAFKYWMKKLNTNAFIIGFFWITNQKVRLIGQMYI